jgi:hypothetical protein
VSRSAQRLLPGGRVARAAGQQHQPVGQARQQCLGRQHAHARRRQLERQRQPVQPPADLDDRLRVVGRQHEGRAHCLRPRDEELHRGCLRQPRGIGAVRQRQRRHRVFLLGGQAQRHAAGGQHRQVRAGVEQRADERGGVDEMLEVVEHQQAGTLAQPGGQHPFERLRA